MPAGSGHCVARGVAGAGGSAPSISSLFMLIGGAGRGDHVFLEHHTVAKSSAPKFKAICPIDGPLRDPGALQVRDVVQEQPGEQPARGGIPCAEVFPLGRLQLALLIGPGDKGREAAGFVLQAPAAFPGARGQRRARTPHSRTSSSEVEGKPQPILPAMHRRATGRRWISAGRSLRRT